MDQDDSELIVRRVESTTQKLPDRHQEEISRLIEAQAQPAAGISERMIEAERKAFAPMGQLIQQDPNALAAVKELTTLNQEAIKAAKPAAVRGTHFLSGRMGMVHPARPGLNLFGPHYDWQVLQPTQGHGAAASSDVRTGSFGVSHGQGVGAGGYRVATAGVSMALQAVNGGFARIAPLLEYEYWWKLTGFGLSAHTEGWCEMLVQDGSGSVLPQGRRTVRLWKHTSQTSAEGAYGDTIYTPDIETTVALAAGQIFHVTLTGTAVVVDSGDGLFAWSYANAWMRNLAVFFSVTF
ncbi:hypothetical protein ACFC0D_38475 [Streptomyces sp. NPDC056222]|uniref:hypothetical protein n=1 Tax=Streptomyces sp. NPDC056222 TaxID=3345749 RepID=UPI0035DF74EE